MSVTPTYFHCSDPPYENYFFADQTVSCQVIIASPLPRSKTHRLICAWPAGNSAVAVFFKPADTNGNLHCSLQPLPSGKLIEGHGLQMGVHFLSGAPFVGIRGQVEFSEAAILDLAILGSIRSVRDYTEGSILNKNVQSGVSVKISDGPSPDLTVTRTWFDETTITTITFTPIDISSTFSINKEVPEPQVLFPKGIYEFKTSQNYPQTPCLPPEQVLRPSYHYLISEQPDAVQALSFLCTADKLLAGAWRFFTYFGRDTMISLLLLHPILSTGQGGAIEAALSSVLERINRDDGSVCHEENIGDYPAAQAISRGEKSHESEYDYKMIDTDFFLPLVMRQYFVDDDFGRGRLDSFLNKTASLIPANKGLTYRQLLILTCRKILDLAEPLCRSGNQDDYRCLISLKSDQPVGQWRDSNDGLGGGRYPYDVNTGLMPAALRAIAHLASVGAFGADNDWFDLASKRASIWEVVPSKFFRVNLPQQEANERLEQYRNDLQIFDKGDKITHLSPLIYEALALTADGSPVEILHTDACFRLFSSPELITCNESHTLENHLAIVETISDSVLNRFPKGLYTEAGILIANPAYSSAMGHKTSCSAGAYHGTVVWSWNSLVMLARGFEMQLDACRDAKSAHHHPVTYKAIDADRYETILKKMKHAYTKIWDTIEANKDHLSAEVWSWKWKDRDGGEGGGAFEYVPLSHQLTPDGAPQTESNIRQLWSLAYLALRRRRDLE